MTVAIEMNLDTSLSLVSAREQAAVARLAELPLIDESANVIFHLLPNEGGHGIYDSRMYLYTIS